MAFEATLSAVGYFLPILAFLLVFIVIYALLVKSGVLGANQGVLLFVSFILAGFFIVEASLVEFVAFSSAWFGVVAVAIFLLLALVGFVPGKEPFKFLEAKNWMSWAVMGVIVAIFIIASAYVFNWAVNWAVVQSWFTTEWFGMILLLVIAAAVSFVITRGAKGK